MKSEIRTLPQKEILGFWGIVRRFLLIVLGAILMALNINVFVHQGNLIPGGFTGCSLLLQKLIFTYLHINIPYTPITLILNSVPVIISFLFIGKKFTLYSCLMILLSGVFTDIIPTLPLTDDILLAAVFGGCINALAIYLCLKAGATSGGTDFIAIFISEKFGIDAWNYVLIFNVFILCIAGLLLGWEEALYSILFQFTSTQTLNYLYRRYQKVTLFIITNNSQVVYEIIRDRTHHDATFFRGEGCYKKTERDLIYSVVSGDEINSLVQKIKKADPSAFINIVKSTHILGKFYRKPND